MIAAVEVAGAGVAVWLLSFALEALRRVPQPPATARWGGQIAFGYVDAGGCRLRHATAGRGPDLVLLHTLRTQLDLFEKVVPALAERFTVHAVDLPGHGFSDIPAARYDADLFVGAVERFLDALDLHDVTLCGVSIGASISLILAARHNPRVGRVVAINPYDYDRGRGLARSSPLARLTVAAARVPVIGETFMRLRSPLVMGPIVRGGVADPRSIPGALQREMYLVGNRPGHYRAFLSLLRNAASWEKAIAAYPRIEVPVRLVWGDRDWARLAERERDNRLVPGAEVVTVEHGGHFLPLDRPDEVVELLLEAAG